MSGIVEPVEGRTQPGTSEESLPFWEATRDRRLLLQWCEECDQVVHFPRSFCPRDGSRRLGWRESNGRGVIYSFTVDHRPPPQFAPGPWVVALIDLQEGARLMTNIVNCPIPDLAVSVGVEVVWEPLPDGRHLPLFRLAAQ